MVQNTRVLTLLLALLLAISCNRIDTALVEEIQGGIGKANENREAFEAGAKKARELFEKMEKAPEGLKNNPQFGYADLYGRIVQLHEAYTSMIVNQNQMISEVEGILADYTEGKMKKDEAKQRAELNLKNFDGYRERIGRMDTFVAEATKAYDNMLAQWEALPEADKLASAKMPAPRLPDATNLKGGSTLLSTGNMPTPPPPPQSTSPGALAPSSGATPQQAAPQAAQQGVQQLVPPQPSGAPSPTLQQQQSGALSPASPAKQEPKRGQ